MTNTINKAFEEHIAALQKIRDAVMKACHCDIQAFDETNSGEHLYATDIRN